MLENRERYEVLVDSSLDWEQDLKGLKLWMVNQQVDRMEYPYFGTFLLPTIGWMPFIKSEPARWYFLNHRIRGVFEKFVKSL